MLTLQQCIEAWNAQADEYNQWPELDADERCEWCLEMSRQHAELFCKPVEGDSDAL